MLLKIVSGAGILTRIAFLPIEHRKLDTDKHNNVVIRNPDSGVDRVLMIFDRNEKGSISPELSSANMFGFCGMFIGAIYGGVLQSQLTNINYRESNEATLYTSNLDAKRKLQNETTVGFSKGALRWGWRTGLFCYSFVGISTIISSYRNKTSVLEYFIAGLVTGALFKTNLGLKGMISGGFFGAALGTFGGSLIVGLIKVSGLSMKQIRDHQYIYTTSKDDCLHAMHRKQMDEEDVLLENYHKNSGERDVSLDSLDAPNEDSKNINNISNGKLVSQVVNINRK